MYKPKKQKNKHKTPNQDIKWKQYTQRKKLNKIPPGVHSSMVVSNSALTKLAIALMLDSMWG